MRALSAWRVVGAVVAVVAAIATPASAGEPMAAVHPMSAVVTIAPLRALVEPLLPAGSTVHVLMAPGRSEHGYEFSPQDVAALATADVAVFVGLNLEPRVAKVLRQQVGGAAGAAGAGGAGGAGGAAKPARRVVCFAEVVGLQVPGEPEPNLLIGAEHDDHHKTDEEHDADHGPEWVDQHLWLDPALVRQLIPAIRAAVDHAGEAGGAAERDRLDAAERALVARVDAVDTAWRTGLEPLRGRSIVTHHNAFSRPAARYGLRVAQVIRASESQEPTPDAVAQVVRTIRKENVRAIFVEPQFNPRAAERIAAAAKVKIARLDPLGDGDWFAMMDANLASLVKNLKE